MDSSILSALSGNNSVKKLVIDTNASKFGEEEILALRQALPGNMGIKHLTIRDSEMRDETCSLLIRSLSTHRRITFLSVPSYFWDFGPSLPLSAEAKSALMNAIIQMLHFNTVVESIQLFHAFDEEEVYRNSIVPRLEMNRNRFQVQHRAMKRADPSIRPQVLGRALHAVRCNANLVFLFLSENVPAFVRTGEEDEDISAAPVEQDPVIVSGQKRKAPS
jgi:hypothetical protein